MRKVEKRKWNTDEIAVFSYSIIMIAVANLLLTKKLFNQSTDFIVHAQHAFLSGIMPSQYPGFYIVYGFFNRIMRLSQENAVVYAQTFFSVTASVVTYGIAGYFISGNTEISNIWKNRIMVIMAFVNPLYSMAYNENRYYLGQISYNAWHNPTNNSVKAIGLLVVFFFLIGELGKEMNVPGRNIKISFYNAYLISAILCMLSLGFKPSFGQVFLPAMLMILLFDWISKRKNLLDCVKIGLLYVPSGGVMLLQFTSTMYGDGGGGIELAPFKVWGYFSSNIPLSVILSAGFPIFCFLFCQDKKENRTDIRKCANISMLLFCLAMSESILLAEKGDRCYHGNFGWGANLAVGFLFLFSTLNFLEYINSKDRESMKSKFIAVIGLMLLSGHFIWGVWYFFKLLTVESMVCW